MTFFFGLCAVSLRRFTLYVCKCGGGKKELLQMIKLSKILVVLPPREWGGIAEQQKEMGNVSERELRQRSSGLWDAKSSCFSQDVCLRCQSLFSSSLSILSRTVGCHCPIFLKPCRVELQYFKRFFLYKICFQCFFFCCFSAASPHSLFTAEFKNRLMCQTILYCYYIRFLIWQTWHNIRIYFNLSNLFYEMGFHSILWKSNKKERAHIYFVFFS